MNKFIALALLLFAILPLKAQVFDPSMAGGGQFENPVTWEASFEKENDSIYIIKIKAELEGNWHLYSQKEVEMDIAPIPTQFTFNVEEEGYELIGETLEPEVEPVYDEVFEADITYFEEEAEFTQKIKVTNPKDTQIIAENL